VNSRNKTESARLCFYGIFFWTGPQVQRIRSPSSVTGIGSTLRSHEALKRWIENPSLSLPPVGLVVQGETAYPRNNESLLHAYRTHGSALARYHTMVIAVQRAPSSEGVCRIIDSRGARKNPLEQGPPDVASSVPKRGQEFSRAGAGVGQRRPNKREMMGKSAVMISSGHEAGFKLTWVFCRAGHRDIAKVEPTKLPRTASCKRAAVEFKITKLNTKSAIRSTLYARPSPRPASSPLHLLAKAA
jgi:hypothetical protein